MRRRRRTDVARPERPAGSLWHSAATGHQMIGRCLLHDRSRTSYEIRTGQDTSRASPLSSSATSIADQRPARHRATQRHMCRGERALGVCGPGSAARVTVGDKGDCRRTGGPVSARWRKGWSTSSWKRLHGRSAPRPGSPQASLAGSPCPTVRCAALSVRSLCRRGEPDGSCAIRVSGGGRGRPGRRVACRW